MKRSMVIGFGVFLTALGALSAPAWAQEAAAEGEAAETEERFAPTPQSLEAARTEPDGVPYEFETDGRIAVVSTIQGHLDRLAQFLQAQEFVDDDGTWVAGDGHLVVLGNLMGYGPKNLETLEYLKSLSDQASEEGGRVHVLIGGTDIFNLRGVMSTMPPSSYEHLATADSRARLDERLSRWLEELWDYNSDFPERQRLNLRENFERFYRRANLPGSLEFTDRYAPGTELGDWLRSSNAIIRINDVLFVSGGLHPIYADIPLDRINAHYRNVINKDSVYVPAMSDVKAGPAIWTGLSFPQGPEEATLREVTDMLAEVEARLMVVGHSPATLGESLLRGRVLHVNNNFLASRDQAAYGGVVFTGPDRYQLINAGRVRELIVPDVPEHSSTTED